MPPADPASSARRRRAAAPTSDPETFAPSTPSIGIDTPVIASPTRTFRLPGGKTMTLSTDRVRATPAVTPQVSFGLGQNAIGLGLWGLIAPKGVNRFLGLQCTPQTTQVLFGARELATGMALFSDPTRASALWARVAGDAFDIAVLSRLVARGNPKHANARLALGVVLAVTALDLVAAIRLSNVKRSRA